MPRYSNDLTVKSMLSLKKLNSLRIWKLTGCCGFQAEIMDDAEYQINQNEKRKENPLLSWQKFPIHIQRWKTLPLIERSILSNFSEACGVHSQRSSVKATIYIWRKKAQQAMKLFIIPTTNKKEEQVTYSSVRVGLGCRDTSENLCIHFTQCLEFVQ